jgi:hypothetical protein
MNLQMLKMLGMQMLVPKLKEMNLQEISALRELLNELFDAAVRDKLTPVFQPMDTQAYADAQAELKRLSDGG